MKKFILWLIKIFKIDLNNNNNNLLINVNEYVNYTVRSNKRISKKLVSSEDYMNLVYKDVENELTKEIINNIDIEYTHRLVDDETIQLEARAEIYTKKK